MSLEIPTWDKIIGALGSTTSEIGGLWANLISDYYNGVDIGLLDPSKKPIIGTLTRYKFEKLGIFDNDQSHYIAFSADDIDTGGTRKVKFRRMNSPYEEDYAVLEGLSQELYNKTLNFANNTISNIPGSAIQDDSITNIKIKSDAAISTSKLADAANFALKNAANVFTTTQKIQYNATIALTMYHPTNVNTNGTGFAFNLRNSNNDEITYGYIFGLIGQNTLNSEQGSLAFYTRNGASLVERMALDHLARLRVGTTSSAARFDPTGLTAIRDFTFPNYNGEVRALGITSIQFKEGWAECAGRIIGHGLLEPVQAYYNTSSVTQSLQGTTTTLFTGTTTNTAAGFATLLTQGITRRSWNPHGFFRTSLSMSSGNAIFMYGFTSRAALLPASNTPISTTESGVLIGFRSTDTEFKVFYNDGAGGAMSEIAFSPSVPVPSATTMHSFEIKMTSAGILCSIYNSGTTLQGSVLLSSGAIPATTTNLNYQGLHFNPTGVDKALSITKIYLRSEK